MPSQSFPSVSPQHDGSGDLFRLLVDGVTDYAIFLVDPAGIVATWNSGAQRMKGYTAAEVIGTHFSQPMSPHSQTNGNCRLLDPM